MTRRYRTFIFGYAMMVVLSTTAPAQQAAPAPDINETIERFKLTAPRSVLAGNRIALPLEELMREACDKDAIVKLGKARQDSGYRRDSANAHVQFSRPAVAYRARCALPSITS